MASIYAERYRWMLERLVAARREAGLTQVEVARALGRGQPFVSKCESGERRLDAVELASFAALYGRPLAHFVGPAPHGGASIAAEGSESGEVQPPARRTRGTGPKRRRRP